MLKKTRAELDAIKGVKPAPPAAPDPVTPALQQFQTSMESVAARMEQAARVFASVQQAEAPQKQLEAIVHRDSAGRMQRVTITVTPQKK